jgi:hypothetical protein
VCPMTLTRKFTAEENERIRWLVKLGHSRTAIAKALDRDAQSIKAKLFRMGIRAQLGRSKPRYGPRFQLTDDEWGKLRAAAEERGALPSALCGQVVRKVIADDLFAAVIDEPMPKRPVPKPAPPPTVDERFVAALQAEAAAARRPPLTLLLAPLLDGCIANEPYREGHLYAGGAAMGGGVGTCGGGGACMI